MSLSQLSATASRSSVLHVDAVDQFLDDRASAVRVVCLIA